jgi:hypothetical protein
MAITDGFENLHRHNVAEHRPGPLGSPFEVFFGGF